jgi:FkbM family methyltransferase
MAQAVTVGRVGMPTAPVVRKNFGRELAFGLMRLASRQFPGSWRMSRPRAYAERHLKRWLAAKVPQVPVVCSTKHGFELIIQPGIDKGIERSIWLHGTYEEGTLALFGRLLREGDVFLDVGANIGLMSLHAACLVGRSGKVFSFEPIPDIHRQLEANIALNRAGQVQAFLLALGARPGALPIYAHPEINRGSSSLVTPDGGEPAHVTSIMTLDDFVAREVHAPLRMIKIDVEGWELEVLKGGQATLSGPDAPLLCVECSQLHPMFGGSVVDLFDVIRTANSYRFFVLGGGKSRPSALVEVVGDDQLPTHDNLICIPTRGRNAVDLQTLVTVP